MPCSSGRAVCRSPRPAARSGGRAWRTRSGVRENQHECCPARTRRGATTHPQRRHRRHTRRALGAGPARITRSFQAGFAGNLDRATPIATLASVTTVSANPVAPGGLVAMPQPRVPRSLTIRRPVRRPPGVDAAYRRRPSLDAWSWRSSQRRRSGGLPLRVRVVFVAHGRVDSLRISDTRNRLTA